MWNALGYNLGQVKRVNYRISTAQKEENKKIVAVMGYKNYDADGNPICEVCKGPRCPQSARRCLRCYLEQAAAKRVDRLIKESQVRRSKQPTTNKTMQQQWTNDTFAESRLKEFGATFTVKDIPVSAINWKESSKNHARADKPIVDDLVEDYALAMESGDIFPMIVLMLLAGTKEYIVLSGNHRFKAAELRGEKMLKAYVVVSSDPSALDVLPRIFNRGHGLRQTKDEAIRNAIWTINAHAMTIQRAAELFGLKPDAIAKQIKIEHTRAVLESGGVKAHKITSTAVHRLSSVALDNVMISLGRIVADAGLSVEQTHDMVMDIRRSENRSEAQQMAAVAEWENRFLTKRLANHSVDEAVEEVSAKRIRTTRVKFITILTTIERIVAGKKRLTQLGIEDKEEKQTIQSRLNDLAKKLNSLSGS